MKILKLSLVATLVMALAGTIAACAQPADKSPANATQTEKPVCKQWIHPDSTAYANLGRRLTELLFNTKKVTAYRVIPRDTIITGQITVDNNFVRGEKIGKLTKEQIAVFNYILLSDGCNYARDTSFIPMIPHLPVIEFEFEKKNEVARVWYSPDNNTWGIHYDDRNLFRYNIAQPDAITRLVNYFLNIKLDEKK